MKLKNKMIFFRSFIPFCTLSFFLNLSPAPKETDLQPQKKDAVVNVAWEKAPLKI